MFQDPCMGRRKHYEAAVERVTVSETDVLYPACLYVVSLTMTLGCVCVFDREL